MVSAPVPTEGPGLLESVWQFRWLSLLIVLGCLATGAAVGSVGSSSPTATATLGLSDPRSTDVFGLTSGSGTSLARYAAGRALFAESDVVLGRAVEKLGPGYTVGRLHRTVTTDTRSDADVITISGTGRNPEEAARVANAVSAAYQERTSQDAQRAAKTAVAAIDTIRTEVLISMALPRKDRTPAQSQAAATAATSTLTTLGLRAAQIEAAAKVFGSGVVFADPAVPSSASSGNGRLRNLVIALLLGLLLATAVAWALAARRSGRPRQPGAAPESDPL